jgi:hypothetical protein
VANALFLSDSQRVAEYKGNDCDWWLRSPGITQSYAANVKLGGNVSGGVTPGSDARVHQGHKVVR